MTHQIKNTKAKTPYWLGFFCLIPAIGVLLGIVLIVLGIVTFKDKKLIIIGSGGIVFTIIFFAVLFYYGTHSKSSQKAFAKISQTVLNDLVRDIEFYKTENGKYPDSLKQLISNDHNSIIVDPLQINNSNSKVYYNFQNKGTKYLLFSSGIDGIANTPDDIYPVLKSYDNNRIGAIVPH